MAAKQEIVFGGDVSGIRIGHTKSKRLLAVFGWYDTYVGIEGGQIALEQFLDTLGVSTRDLKKIIKNREKNAKEMIEKR
jgi:hypothetical protein